MADGFDEQGRIIIGEPPKPDATIVKKKATAKTAAATETEPTESMAMLNAKIDALLKVQGINPLTIKVDEVR